MKTFFFLLCIFLISTTALAMPSEADRQEALELMYQLSSDQELHFRETSNYETTTARWRNGFVYQACAYSNFVGKGHVTTVSKVIKGKVYNIERHFGDDANKENNISVNWTCVNCNGERYEIVKEANEHGLCNI